MKHSRSYLSKVLLLALLISPAQLFTQKQPLRGFDAYVNKALKDWDCAGLAIAIVKNDSVIFSKGYGVRELGSTAPVSDRTVFGIASCSKAFTAAAVGILVDEGRIQWDDPVVRRLPGFELYDPYVTREITVRDLLCHRSGLPAFGGDILWWGSTYDRNETLRRVRFVKPASSFRSRYAYQNIMFIAAGQVVAKASGMSWDDFVRRRIFEPLDMRSTTTSISGILESDERAIPHLRVDGVTRSIKWRNLDNGAAAAGINSNVRDMAQWIRLQLNRGIYAGKRIFSPSVAEEMWSLQTAAPNPVPQPPLPASLRPHFVGYGLGWSLSEYRNRYLVRHYGETDGMSSVVGLLPEEKLGVVILTNLHVTSLHTALLYRIFDSFLGVKQEEWSARYLKIRQDEEEKEALEWKEAEKGRVRTSAPSHPPERYAGRYTNTIYGEATVSEKDGKLVVHLAASPTYVGDLEHWHFDTFLSRWRDPIAGKTFVTFGLKADGEIDEMKLKVADFIDFGEYVFKRSR